MIVRKFGTESKKTYLLSLILFIDCLTAFAFISLRVPSLIVITIWSQQLVRGFRYPLFGDLVQHRLDSDERATFISLISTIGSLLYFLATVFLDVMKFSLIDSLTFAAFMHVVLTLVFVTLSFVHLSSKINTRRISSTSNTG